MLLQLIDPSGELASTVLNHLGARERIRSEIADISLAIENALNTAGEYFENWIAHLSTGIVVRESKARVDKALTACKNTGMSDEDAQIFVVNAAFSELMGCQEISLDFREAVKIRLGLG